MKFRDIVEGSQEKVVKDFEKKIKAAKKGDCAKILKDLEASFKARKIGAKDFDELTAAAGRKMDKLQEAVQCPECMSENCKLNESEYVCEDCGSKFEAYNEDVQGINETGVGAVITTTLAMIAQAHAWHLLVKSGQKHTALGEFYEELQDEVDELAERFIAQGGQLQAVQGTITVDADYGLILSSVAALRDQVSRCAAATVSPEMASILDGVVDIQECIDSFVYKFKLD